MSPVLRVLRSIGRVIIIVIALLYFIIDALFLRVVRPVRRRILSLPVVRRTQVWVHRLSPYASLCFLLIPWLILEPLKPLGIILFHHGHHLTSALVFIVGELLKLAIFDQIFEMTKPKLMTLPWFAWCYTTWRGAVDYVRNLPMWRQARTWVRSTWSRVSRTIEP